MGIEGGGLTVEIAEHGVSRAVWVKINRDVHRALQVGKGGNAQRGMHRKRERESKAPVVRISRASASVKPCDLSAICNENGRHSSGGSGS